MKTVILKLNPGSRKRSMLERLIEEETRLINRTVARLATSWLIDDCRAYSQYDVQRIAKEICSSSWIQKNLFIEGIGIKAAQMWTSFHRRGCPIDKETGNPLIPALSRKMVYLRTRTARFISTKRGNYALAISDPSIPRKYHVLPLKGHRYDGVIDWIVGEKHPPNQFTLELLQKGGGYFAHIMLDLPKPEPSVPRSVVGVDLGIRNLVTLAAIDLDGNLLGTEFFKGGKVHSILKRMDERTSERQSHKKEIGGAMLNFKKNLSHNLSREIINFSQKYLSPAIAMENLTGIRDEFGKWTKKGNRRQALWDYRRMANFVEYKAEAEGIPFRKVKARGTSSTCPKCGSKAKRDRKRHETTCISCGYTLNDDLLGAYNIALRGMRQIIGSENP